MDANDLSRMPALAGPLLKMVSRQAYIAYRSRLQFTRLSINLIL